MSHVMRGVFAGMAALLLPVLAFAQGTSGTVLTSGTVPTPVAVFHRVDAGVLPGNVLHPIERLVERASVALTLNPGRRAEREVQIADERAAELDRVQERAAFEGGNERPVATALREFDEQERRASASMDRAGDRAEAMQHAQAFRSAEHQVILDTVVSFGGETVSAAAIQLNERLAEEQAQRFSETENPVVRVALREQVAEHQLDYAAQRGAALIEHDRQGSAEQKREIQDNTAAFVQSVEERAVAQEEAAADAANELQYRVEQAGFGDLREAHAALEILSASDRAVVNDFLEAPTRGEADRMASAVRALRRANEREIRERAGRGDLDRYLDEVAAGVVVNKFGSSASTDIVDVSPENLDTDRARVSCAQLQERAAYPRCDARAVEEAASVAGCAARLGSDCGQDGGEQDCVSSPTHVCPEDDRAQTDCEPTVAGGVVIPCENEQVPALTCADRMTPLEYRTMGCCTNQSEPLDRRVANGCLEGGGEQDCVSSPTHVCPEDNRAQDDEGQQDDNRDGGAQGDRR